MDKKKTGILLAWLAGLTALCTAGTFLKPYAVEPEAAAGIVINELMSENTSCAPHNGFFSDWIELVNTTDRPVSLNGMRLISDTNPKKVFPLPAIELAPGETAVVYAQGSRGLRDEYAAHFTLSPTGGTLMLLDGNFGTADEVVYPALEANTVYARSEDGSFSVTGEFTPGLPNTHENHLLLLNADPVPGDFLISAICPDPVEGADYITVTNVSSGKASLDGWYLSDNRRNLVKQRLSGITLAAGESRKIELGRTFSLKASGESLYLTDPEGTVRAKVSWDALGKGVVLAWDGTRYVTSSSETFGVPASDICISETAVRLTDSDDFVEIANLTASDIDIGGYGISDDPEKPRKATVPLGTVLPANGVYCMYLKDETMFRLKSDGSETVVLAAPDGTILDTLSTAGLRVNTSVGRDPQTRERVFYTAPTPGAVNGRGVTELLSAVSFSHDGGQVAEDSISVALSGADGATIFYTTDGTEPTQHSSVYTEPILLSANTVIRAVQAMDGASASEPAARTYIFDKQHTLPLVTISGTAADLTDKNGILKTGSKAKTPAVSAEFYAADGTLLTDALLEMKMVGHQSRTDFPNKSFKLTARAELGASRIEASLFRERDYEEYKSVVLRASGQDYKQTRMRDSILTSLAGEMGMYSQASEPCAVYVNAKYLGHYNLRERVSIQSIAQFEGWSDPQKIELIETTDYTAANGSPSTFRSLMKWLKSADLTDDASFRKLEKAVDIDNYLDYVALMMYTADKDLDNLRVYRSEEGDNRFRWVVFDLDLSYTTDLDSPSEWLKPGGVGKITKQDNTLFVKLMERPEIRSRFLERMGGLMNTVFSAEHVTEKITARYNLIADEMRYHTDLWKWSYDDWVKNVKSMASYAQKRPEKLKGYLIDAFRLTDAEAAQYFGE